MTLKRDIEESKQTLGNTKSFRILKNFTILVFITLVNDL
jgi:hypothetical protein